MDREGLQDLGGGVALGAVELMPVVEAELGQEAGVAESARTDHHRAWAALVHVFAFVLFVGLLRAETAATWGIGTWIGQVLGAMGAVLLLEAALLAVERVLPSRGLRIVVRVVVCSALLIDHQFRLETGSAINFEYLAAAWQQMGSLGGLVASGADPRLPWRLAQALGCLAFAAVVAPRPAFRLPVQGTRLALETAIAVTGLVLYVSGGVASGGPTWNAASILGLAPEPVAVTGEPEKLYEAPRISGRAARRPNIVIIALESTRASVVGAYGKGGPSVTPELDAIASRGLLFENAYTSVTHTSKAMLGLLCGTYPAFETRVRESYTRGNGMACLPHLLRKLGYRSRFMMSADGDFENFPGLVRNMGFGSWMMRDDLGGRGFEKVGYFGLDERSLLEPALDWVRSGEEPFFLTILTSVGHHPYERPGAKRKKGREHDFESYRESVAHVDEVVGELVRRLEAEAPGETLFVFTADHGEAFGEHGSRIHDLVPYEEGTHVPLILYGTEWLGEPRRVGGLRQHFDVIPTILEALGVRWGGKLPGMSLLDEKGHEFVITSCFQPRNCLAMRMGDLKFVYRYGFSPMQAYDLARDPLEKKNVVASLPRSLVRAAEERLASLDAAVVRSKEDAREQAKSPAPKSDSPVPGSRFRFERFERFERVDRSDRVDRVERRVPPIFKPAK
ncbi:LTA synthase family protein [Vulgatibacter incomptus]|uniref:Phosphoglycerol transferase I n=1 Tax=Vulgatibacter incomptus TaxID=1391653 RepID=A0A0K1P9V4_9BACT|nr:LTA synthase family protein [Vulgatibacter incomptus]AKU90313.1 Phosphoglycerol transferase I [Vulgatibacter incomptus]